VAWVAKLHRKIPLLRNVYTRLDDALAERDELRIRLDKIDNQPNRMRQALSRPHLTDPDNALLPETPDAEAVGPKIAAEDAKLIERTRVAYKLAMSVQAARTSSFWEQSYYELKRDIHEALVDDDPVRARDMLRDPRRSDLLFGFEILSRTILHWPGAGLPVYLDLALLAQATGARRLWNPEYLGSHPEHIETYPDVEALLKTIDDAIGFRVTFPNPFPGEKGLPTSRGVASIRAVQALYQAWLIASLIPSRDGSVLEIGAGTGRTAFYATQLGIMNYTIVDIPMTNVAQANFLGRTLGENRIALYGEPADSSRVRILPTTVFFGAQDRFDLVVNVDSLTEMARETALAYCSEMKTRARTILSINHEYNDFTVRELASEAGLPKGSRHPYWLRRGYVEERFSL
jgi:SAM-dependent methyltransferase